VDKPRWRWRNVPVPEVYVILLTAGIAIHFFLPVRIFPGAWLGRATGGLVLLAALLLAAQAVGAAAEIDIARPARVVISGPYRFSRNPMYLAWTFITVGIGLIVNSGWVVMLLPGAVLFTHLVVIPREEQALERRFGQGYLAYKNRVHRWLGVPRSSGTLGDTVSTPRESDS
jgi:protein-S-isoprenylcysteine O-methyltransferase Ste14